MIVEIDPEWRSAPAITPRPPCACLHICRIYARRGGETVSRRGHRLRHPGDRGGEAGRGASGRAGHRPRGGKDRPRKRCERGLDGIIDIAEADSPLAFEGVADLVVANIVPNVIMAMAEALCEKVKPGGRLITSGIVHERADEVRAKLESVGLATLEERADGDWVAIISERRARMSNHRRFFVRPEQIAGEMAVLTGSQARQIAKVLRLTEGDHICLLDGSGVEHQAVITALSSGEVTARIVGTGACETEARIKLRLAVCLPKGDKIELIVQKCTELGISELIVVRSERTVARLDAPGCRSGWSAGAG